MKRKHSNKHDRVGSSYDFANNEGFDNYEDRLQDRRGEHNYSPQDYGSDRYSHFDQGSRQPGQDYRDDMPTYGSSSYSPSSYDQGSTYGQDFDSRRYRQQSKSPSRRYETQYGAGSFFNRQENNYDYWSPATYQNFRGSGLHAGKGPKNFRRSDERIREEVCQALTDHADIDASEVEVEVKDGIVNLSGTVESRQIKRMAEETIESMPGVLDVRNNLRVMAISSSSQDRESSYMSAQSNRAASTTMKSQNQKQISTSGKSVQ